ncbi:hypothetical protein CBC_0675 [Clostridium botulinum C str. Eklund]|nr:hypothetical protein CBC_0675 [Clostridium botulinum C str. Eklund]NEZ50077.1 hypothetical protein [Clostridium botulinum]
METIAIILFLAGVIGIIVSLILIIKNAIKKQENTKNKKILLACLALAVASFIAVPTGQANKDTQVNNTTKIEENKNLLTEKDRELLKKHYKDFDVEQRTQFAEIEDKYKKMNDSDKKAIKVDFERMCKERGIQVKKWEEEDKKKAAAEKIEESKKWEQFVKENSKKLTAGEHIVGKHIAKGNYNVTFNGNGNFIVYGSDGNALINEIGGYQIKKYKAILPEGSKIQLKGMSANFTPIKATLTPYKSVDIYAGYWVVGTDITKGRYKASTSKGNGNFIIYSSNGSAKVNEILGEAGVKEVVVDLDNGDIVDIKGLNNIKLTPEK